MERVPGRSAAGCRHR